MTMAKQLCTFQALIKAYFFYNSKPTNDYDFKHPSFGMHFKKMEDLELDAPNAEFLYDSPDNYIVGLADNATATSFFNKLKKFVKSVDSRIPERCNC